MTETISSKINRFAARWWADRLDDQHADQRAAFEREILARLPEGDWDLRCDHDPQDTLLEALRAAGIPCQGFLYSAMGILPSKHLLIRRGNTLYRKEGRGNFLPPLTFSPTAQD